MLSSLRSLALSPNKRKQYHELVLHSFETTTEATTADALLDIALFVQEQACHGLIAAEVHRRYYRNCHDLGVTQHALRVISVMFAISAGRRTSSKRV